MEIYSAFDQNVFQSKFDKGHSHVDSQADGQVFTRRVMIVFSAPNSLNINSRELTVKRIAFLLLYK